MIWILLMLIPLTLFIVSEMFIVWECLLQGEWLRLFNHILVLVFITGALGHLFSKNLLHF